MRAPLPPYFGIGSEFFPGPVKNCAIARSTLLKIPGSAPESVRDKYYIALADGESLGDCVE